MIVSGVPVTTVARTVVDLARELPFPAGVVAADSALHRRRVTRAELAAVLRTCAGWPRIERARRVIEFADRRAESALESVARVAFWDCGLPAPQLQAWVGSADGEVVGRCDFLWPVHSTIAEADGAMKYADPRRAIEQLRRDARLRDAGFEVVHFGWRDIEQSPEQVAAAIRAAFRRGDLAANRDQAM
jgi:hypothetical protein